MKKIGKGHNPTLIFCISLVVLSLVALIVLPSVNHWQQTKAENAGGTVRIGANASPKSLDIRKYNDKAITQALLGNVYQTLVGLDEFAKPVPQIASSWERSNDGLSYTFYLQENQTFEDGSPIDSSAVLWSMEEIIKNKYVGYDDLANIGTVTNPSAYKLVIELKNADAQLPYQLAGHAGIVYNRGAHVNYDNTSAGSGPYTVDSFKPRQELVLRKSKNYHGSNEATTSRIIFSYADQSKGQAQQVESGKLDAAVDVTAQEVRAARDIKSGITISTGMSNENIVLAFNHSKNSITSDERVRQAICYAIDRKAIADASYGTQKILEGPLNELSVGYDPAFKAVPHDSQKAASLASYFGKDAYGNHLRLVYDDSLGQTIGEQIKEQLAQANIPSEVIMLDHAAFENRVLNRRDYELTLLKMSNEATAEFSSPYSTMNFDNPESQQFFHLVQNAKSDGDYASQLKQYARTLTDQSASAWLTQKTPVTITSDKIKGLPNNMVDSYLPAWKIQTR